MLLAAGASTTCVRATHNEFDRTVPRPSAPASAARERQLGAAADHRDDVVAQWVAAGPALLDLRPLGRPGPDGAHDSRAHTTATVEALRAGWDVVVGGRLPDDPAGGRTGRSDALVRDRSGGYHPVRIVGHKVLEPRRGERRADVPTSALARPGHADAGPSGSAFRSREDDALQLAHQWRMLQAAGFAAAAAAGGVVGTDADPGAEPRIAWRDLDEARFHRVQDGATVVLSALAVQDAEHAVRLAVAAVARNRTGAPDDPAPLVDPLGCKDCATCRWEPVCVATLPADDVSRVLRGQLSPAEHTALRALGLSTVDRLAAADPVALAGPDATPARVSTWRAARLGAELARDGLVVRGRPGTVPAVPRTRVEVDVDMECSATNRVYLWGALVSTRDGGTERREFHPVLDLDVQDDAAERSLLEEFLRWLLAEHPTATVFHYSPVERTHVRRILAGRPWPGQALAPGTSADPTTWVDLLPPVRACLDSRSGHGLKVVATHGAGFSWRDAEPDGWESQVWLEAARAGDTAARRRLLEYNEDDVRATLAVRDWLAPRAPLSP